MYQWNTVYQDDLVNTFVPKVVCAMPYKLIYDILYKSTDNIFGWCKNYNN